MIVNPSKVGFSLDLKELNEMTLSIKLSFVFSE